MLAENLEKIDKLNVSTNEKLILEVMILLKHYYSGMVVDDVVSEIINEMNERNDIAFEIDM